MSTAPDLLPPFETPQPIRALRTPPPATAQAAPTSGAAPARWRAPPRRRYHGRVWRMAIGGVLLATVSSAFLCIAAWFQPPQPLSVTLVGAGYEQNLALPQNVCGFNSLRDLARTVSGTEAPRYWGHRLWRGTPTVQTLQSGFDWQKALAPQSPPTQLLYMSAHGAADAKGAYLLSNDAGMQDDSASRLRITTLLDRLEELPAAKHKILVLDASFLVFQPELGVLQNEFVRDLKKLDARIAEIPNLVVITSADADQRSWQLPSWGRTIFSHFFIEGIHGAAHDTNDDGRITLSELFDFTARQSSDWVARHQQAMQTPILLPLGPEGRERAGRIAVGWRKRNYTPTAISMTSPGSIPRELLDAWQQAHVLASRETPPYVQQPQTWRRYLATLKRYESLVLMGDRESAPRLYEQLGRLAEQCSRDSSLVYTSLDASRAAPRPQLESQADRILDTLANVAVDERRDTWQKQSQALGESIRPLRAALFRRLIEQAIADPITQLRTVCELAEIVRDPLEPLPADLHFATMLDQDLPADRRTVANLALLSQVLRLRALAEVATFGDTDGFTSASPLVRPWVAKLIEQADAERRLGEDLLFVATADMQIAVTHFQAATKLYQQALEQGQLVLKAMQTRDDALALLPEVGDAAASVATDGGQHPFVTPEECTDLDELWRNVHALARQLSQPEPEFLHLPPKRDNQSGLDPASLVERTDQVVQGLERVKQKISTHWEKLASQDHVSNQLGMVDFPVTPTLPVELRSAGVQQQLQMLQRRHEDMSQLLLIVSGSHFARNITPMDITAIEQERQLQEVAKMRGHLALAVLGSGIFDELAQSGNDNWGQSQFRLEMLPVEHSWRSSVRQLGEQIALRWSRLPTEVTGLLAAATAEDKQCSSLRCVQADDWSRLVPIAYVAQLDDAASQHLQHLRLGEYLLWQAERDWLDHWYARSANEAPYYQTMGLAMVSDAQRVAPKLEKLSQVRELFAQPDDWSIQSRDAGALTNELPLQLGFELTTGKSAFSPTGYSALTWQVPSPISIDNEDASPPVLAAWHADRKPVELFTTLEVSPSAASQADMPERTTSQITLEAYYRGRHVQRKVPVEVYLQPEILIRNAPRPSQAHYIGVASSELQQRYGQGQGSIAIVLDASGSMGNKPGQKFDDKTRYAMATAALDKVLGGVPPGTKLSLWIFGQAVGATKTVKAERTIHCLRPLSPWNPVDRAALIKHLTYPAVEPWNESAVVHAILEAQKDLLQASGFKSMVVLTDGIDNRFEQDTQDNPQHLDVATALSEHFRNTGIVLNIVGFQIASHEDQLAQAQFSVIETFNPPGQFYRVDQSQELVAALSAASDQRLRYWVQDYDRRLVDGIPPGGLPMTNIRQALDASVVALPPGEFLVRLWANGPHGKDLVVEGGDLLAGNLIETSSGLSLSRLPILTQFFADRPTQRASAWRVAILSATTVRDEATAQVAIEREPDPRERQLAVIKPRDLWWEVTTPSGALVPTYRSQVVYNRPTPQWEISMPITGGSPAPKLKLSAWWLVANDVPADVTLIAGRDFQKFSDLNGRSLQVNGETLRIENVRVVQREMDAADGPPVQQPCLVATLHGPAGQTYLLRVPSADQAGREHRLYPSIGRYIAQFWPCDEAGFLSSGCRFEIVSLAAIKAQAEQRGTHVTFDELQLTPATQPLPPPPSR